MRPASSTCSVWMKPCPSSPISCAGDTRQFCRITSVVSLARMPSLSSFLPASRPPMPRSRMNAEMPFGALRLVGHRHDHERVGRGAVRDEHLRAVQHPAVAVLDRRRAHRRGVAARAGLGQAPRRQLLALARAATRYFCFCSSLREHRDVRGAKTVVRRHRQRHAGIDAGELLDADAVVDRAHAGAAVRLGELDAHQPELGELGQQLLRKVLGLVPLHDVGTNFASRRTRERFVRRSCCSSVRAKSIGTIISAGDGRYIPTGITVRRADFSADRQ